MENFLKYNSEDRLADMEIRGKDNGQHMNRPAISRRSCDQCRARKIGCDRGSPCSNCSTARIECTHSAIASRNTAPRSKQVSSERRIDDIAEAIDDIKQLLRNLDISGPPIKSQTSAIPAPNHVGSIHALQYSELNGSTERASPLGDHSAHLGRFVEDIVEDGALKTPIVGSHDVLNSLRDFARPNDNRHATTDMSAFGVQRSKFKSTGTSMPPLDAAVSVLRWAKDHPEYYKVLWLCQILPLEIFTKVCQKVYFAVDGYSDVEYILANGYLYWLFAEQVIITGSNNYVKYSIQCEQSLNSSLGQLSLLLPATMMSTAALLVGALHAIENAKASLAWTFASAASNFCMTLGYHQSSPAGASDPMADAKSQLFWTVYGIDKSLSFRFNRASIIRDYEITLLPLPKEYRCTKMCRIQGKVYDQLLSPLGLSRSEVERHVIAEALAAEANDLINESKDDESRTKVDSDDVRRDTMRAVYIRIEQSMQISLLTMILNLSGSSERCIAAAHASLDVHEKCIQLMHGNEPYMRMNYTSWAILHTPFIPFIILFNHSLQYSSIPELSRLETFTSSLQPNSTFPESAARPHRLFQLLCEVARLYIDSNTSSNLEQQNSFETTDYLNMLSLPDFGTEMIYDGDSQHQIRGGWCDDDDPFANQYLSF